jgi:lysophospholipase L1-like esterase
MLDQLKSARGLTGLALAVSVVALLGAESASAGCGGVQQENPKKNVSLGRAPLAIGDSPMLLALDPLAQEGYRANARGCRQYTEGLALIRDLKRQDKLPRLVVIALGSNGVITEGDLREALDLLGKKRTLGLVTPRESGGGSGHDAELVREFVHDHKHRTFLLDWVEYSAGHSSWFQPDGLHLTFDGADAMAQLFKKALKVLPKAHHHHHHGHHH